MLRLRSLYHISQLLFSNFRMFHQIEVSPLLIEKGSTKVAIYGMGAMREARLNRMWSSKKVQFLRPEEDETGENDENEADSGFLNIFALHQNRDFGRGAKNCVQESMVPDWMDIVIFGHEHECLISFAESVVGTFRITQPGSSVATSLVAGEAVRKHIGILDVKGRRYRMDSIPLTQVRSFITSDLSLQEHKIKLDPEDPKIDDKINALLEKEVQVAVRNAHDRTKEVIAEALAVGNDAGEKDSPLLNRIEKPNEVLIRIRVEHSGFSTINNQRFGARFVDDVANASDILLFHRRKEVKPTTKKLSAKERQQFLKTPLDPENLERIEMEDLVMEFFSDVDKQDRALRMLDKTKLTESLAEYVDKSASSTIEETTDRLIAEKQKLLLAKLDRQDEAVKGSAIREYFDEELAKTMETDAAAESKKKSSRSQGQAKGKDDDNIDVSMEKENSRDSDNDDDAEEEAPPIVKKRQAAKPLSSKAKSSSQSQRSRARETIDLSSDDDNEPAATTSQKPKKPSVARPKRAQSTKRKSYKLDSDSDNDSDAVIEVDAGDDGFQRPKKRTPAPSTRNGKASQPSSQGRNKTSTKRSRLLNDSDDDMPAGLDTESYGHERWGSTATKSQL
jgi:double-strand break repair protein MRE11